MQPPNIIAGVPPLGYAIGQSLKTRQQVRDEFANLVEESVSSRRLNLFNRIDADLTDLLRVDPQNEAAIPMYISLDYTPTGDHKLTTYHYVDGLGNTHAREETDAIYRKSLRLLGL